MKTPAEKVAILKRLAAATKEESIEILMDLTGEDLAWVSAAMSQRSSVEVEELKHFIADTYGVSTEKVEQLVAMMMEQVPDGSSDTELRRAIAANALAEAPEDRVRALLASLP